MHTVLHAVMVCACGEQQQDGHVRYTPRSKLYVGCVCTQLWLLELPGPKLLPEY
jgi:hypothetical protein